MESLGFGLLIVQKKQFDSINHITVYKYTYVLQFCYKRVTDEMSSLSLQDVDKPCDTLLQQVSIEEILEEQRLQQQAKQETEKVKMQVLKDRGLSIPKADNLDEY